MSMVRRALLGPARPATCTNCGGKIGVPFGKSVAALSPALVASVIAAFAPNPAVHFAVWVIGLAVAIVAFYKLVPLVKA